MLMTIPTIRNKNDPNYNRPKLEQISITFAFLKSNQKNRQKKISIKFLGVKVMLLTGTCQWPTEININAREREHVCKLS